MPDERVGPLEQSMGGGTSYDTLRFRALARAVEALTARVDALEASLRPSAGGYVIHDRTAAAPRKPDIPTREEIDSLLLARPTEPSVSGLDAGYVRKLKNFARSARESKPEETLTENLSRRVVRLERELEDARAQATEDVQEQKREVEQMRPVVEAAERKRDSFARKGMPLDEMGPENRALCVAVDALRKAREGAKETQGGADGK